ALVGKTVPHLRGSRVRSRQLPNWSSLTANPGARFRKLRFLLRNPGIGRTRSDTDRKERSSCDLYRRYLLVRHRRIGDEHPEWRQLELRKEMDNKTAVGRWFTQFWGKTCDLAIVDELAAPDMLLQYSLHAPRRGRDDIKAFMTDFRKAFPDLDFWGTADLIAKDDYVVGRW